MRPTPRATYTRSFRDGPKTAKLRTSNAASLRNRTPPRANLMPAEASASKRGYDSRPQALSRPPRGVASNLTPSHAARWERRTWELLNSFCLHWSVAEAVPPVEPEPVDGLASTGDGHSAPIVKLSGTLFLVLECPRILVSFVGRFLQTGGQHHHWDDLGCKSPIR